MPTVPWRALLASSALVLAVALPRVDPASADVAPVAPPQTNRGSTLLVGQALGPDEYLTSASGRFRFDANFGILELLKGTGFLHTTPYQRQFSGVASVGRLVLQTDGNLVLYTDRGVTFQSGTAGRAAERLVVQDDGNVVVYGPAGRVVYAFGLEDQSVVRPLEALLSGDRATSPDGTVLVMQGDGNLVLYARGAARWSSGTFSPGSAAFMQPDGNLVVYRPTGRPRGGRAPRPRLLSGGTATCR